MKLLILWLGVFYTSMASAAFYKCTDDVGTVSYQKTQCQNLKNAAQMNMTTGGYKYLAEEQKKIVDKHQATLTAEQRREEKQLRKQQKRQRLLDLSDEQAQKNQYYLRNNKASFSPYAIPPYQGKKYADIVANFLPRLHEIERYRKIAAISVLDSGQCQRVEVVELVPTSRIENLKFTVDCRNGKRIKFTERDLQIPKPPAAAQVAGENDQ
jgi:hypothetical protein